jgi:hypothetical protein
MTAACLAALTIVACSSLTDVPPPSNIVDPGVVQSQDGALAVYRGVVAQFADLFALGVSPTSPSSQSYAYVTGAFTDEYMCTTTLCGAGSSASFDLRKPPLDVNVLYQTLHKTRLSADQAIGLLAQYAPSASPALRGQMYALKGYIYIMFGEFFCSGIPFSQAVYGGDIVYGTSLTTSQMFEAAVAQFDTALTLAADSARIVQLASVGRGRALLDLGRFADARDAVANVTTTFRYEVNYNTDSPNYVSSQFFNLRVADHEGTNGLNFSSGSDPRLPLTGGLPSTLVSSPGAPVVLADGIEARLIEAEADLHDNLPTWATTLNALRDGVSMNDLTADSTTLASATLRQDVLFRERAFWLFGTGHRQGDMRRLIRQYGRQAAAVYPWGAYAAASGPFNTTYSPLIVVDPPAAEAQDNPNYQGCLNHAA